VAAGAEVGTLGHDNPFAQHHRRHRVADHARAEAGLGGHLQVPGGPDAGIAVDVASGCDAGTEAAQQPAAPGVQRRRRRPEEKHVHQLPGEPGQAVAAAEAGALKRCVISEDHGAGRMNEGSRAV